MKHKHESDKHENERRKLQEIIDDLKKKEKGLR